MLWRNKKYDRQEGPEIGGFSKCTCDCSFICFPFSFLSLNCYQA